LNYPQKQYTFLFTVPPKNIILLVVIVAAALLAVYVWPTRYIYGSEKTGEYTHVIRIDRFSDRVWVLSSEGWKERTPVAPTNIWDVATHKMGQDATPPKNPIDAAISPSPLPEAPKAKPSETMKRWATVNDDTSIFKLCHFDAGNTTTDGCDFPTQDPPLSAIAVVKKGERVAMLSSAARASGGKNICKVKFERWVGWMDAADLTPE
jgi:hypothetical protein